MPYKVIENKRLLLIKFHSFIKREDESSMKNLLHLVDQKNKELEIFVFDMSEISVCDPSCLPYFYQLNTLSKKNNNHYTIIIPTLNTVVFRPYLIAESIGVNKVEDDIPHENKNALKIKTQA